MYQKYAAIQAKKGGGGGAKKGGAKRPSKGNGGNVGKKPKAVNGGASGGASRGARRGASGGENAFGLFIEGTEHRARIVLRGCHGDCGPVSIVWHTGEWHTMLRVQRYNRQAAAMSGQECMDGRHFREKLITRSYIKDHVDALQNSVYEAELRGGAIALGRRRNRVIVTTWLKPEAAASFSADDTSYESYMGKPQTERANMWPRSIRTTKASGSTMPHKAHRFRRFVTSLATVAAALCYIGPKATLPTSLYGCITDGGCVRVHQIIKALDEPRFNPEVDLDAFAPRPNDISIVFNGGHMAAMLHFEVLALDLAHWAANHLSDWAVRVCRATDANAEVLRRLFAAQIQTVAALNALQRDDLCRNLVGWHGTSVCRHTSEVSTVVTKLIAARDRMYWYTATPTTSG